MKQQIKKATRERDLWELSRHLRCRKKAIYFGGEVVCVLLGGGVAGLIVVPAGLVLPVPVGLAAPELVEAGTLDCAL